MIHRFGLGLVALVAGSSLVNSAVGGAQGRHGKETRMSRRATGTFDAKVTPIAAETKGETASFGRLALDKQFHGDLEGSSNGEMWTVGTEIEGSAGYVAIERVSGTLQGRTGTFALLHQGTMQSGADFKLAIVVVPDSGTGQLQGLMGKLAITIAPDRTHSYDFDYTLPEAP